MSTAVGPNPFPFPGSKHAAYQAAPASSLGIAGRWTAGKCLALHAAIVGIVLILHYLDSFYLTITLGGVMAMSAFFFFAWLETRRTYLKLTPISVYFLWQGFALGPAAIYVGYTLATNPVSYGPYVLQPFYMERAFVIGLLGTLPLHAGMLLTRPKEILEEQLPTVHQVARLLPVIGLTFLVGCIALGFHRRLMFLGVIASFFQFAGHGALVSFVLLPKDRLGLSEGMRAALILIGTALLFIAATTTGSKMYLMFSLVALPFYVMQRPGLRRHLLVIIGFLIFLYLTLIAPTISQSRFLEFRYKLSHSEALLRAAQNSPIFTGQFDADFYDEQIRTLFTRQFEASAIAVVVQLVESRGYLNGETFYQLRYFLIPRLLWPEKPIMVRGTWFASYLGFAPRASDATVSVGLEAAGELYWNFGYPGIILGMYILGAMFGLVWRMAGANPVLRPLHMSLYMLNTLTMMNLPEAGSRMVSCIYMFIFFGLIFALLRSYRPSRTLAFRRSEGPQTMAP